METAQYYQRSPIVWQATPHMLPTTTYTASYWHPTLARQRSRNGILYTATYAALAMYMHHTS